MNIFVLDKHPTKAAEFHCDKHTTKMIVEYAQLLSTTHRLVSGTHYRAKSKNGRNISRWRLSNPDHEKNMYKATHWNNPCTKWVRESKGNYFWLWELAVALCGEYTRRYGKTHKTESIIKDWLYNPPKDLPSLGLTRFPFPSADQQYHRNDIIETHRLFYMGDKINIAKWKMGNIPEWWNPSLHFPDRCGVSVG